jgi:GNAT superfamily N-acetyltransferase
VPRELRLRRIATREELPPAIELAREFGEWASARILAEFGIEIPPEADHPVELLEDLLGHDGRLYVAELDREPVGVGGLKRLSADTAEIKRMYVRPSGRGEGAGRAIVERLVADARELGYTTLYLESASFMHEAHALYRSVGFVETASYAGREFEGVAHDVSIFMRLGLPAPPENRQPPAPVTRR